MKLAKRLAVRTGETALSVICFFAAIEAYHWGAIGLQMWRERR